MPGLMSGDAPDAVGVGCCGILAVYPRRFMAPSYRPCDGRWDSGSEALVLSRRLPVTPPRKTRRGIDTDIDRGAFNLRHRPRADADGH